MNRRQMMMLTAAMASSAANVAVASGKHADNSLPLFDPIGFGAKGDGKALDSRAINAAIDACNKAGGGIVYLRPGTYRSGTVVLQSNVTLYLEAGATILGSLDLNDYREYPGLPDNQMPGPPPKGDANQRHLIFAVDAENVTLAGPGRIDGQGTHFIEPSGRPDLPPEDQWAEVTAHAWKKKETGRPSPMMEFVNCRWLRIEDVRIENSPGWTLRPYNCDNVYIRGISVKSPNYTSNADGMDLTGCQNVFISDCSIDTGDDAICLKSESPYGGEPRLARNIVVTNCILTTCCNGFKLGTASEGGFENITFSNSVIYNKPGDLKGRVISGIALEVVDGGWIDGFVATGIRMQRTRTPIFIRLGNRQKKYDNSQHGLRGVMIENVHASESLLASSITGMKGVEIEDVTLSSIRIDNVLPSRPEWINHLVPEKEGGYPEARMFGMLPASGLYIRHVSGLSLRDLSFRAAAAEARPTVIFDDVQRVRMSGLASTVVSGDQPVVSMKDASDVWISESAAPAGTGSYLGVEGAASGNILLSNSDMRGAQKIVELGVGLTPKTVTAKGNIEAE
jgi:polygalacturonase